LVRATYRVTRHRPIRNDQFWKYCSQKPGSVTTHKFDWLKRPSRVGLTPSEQVGDAAGREAAVAGPEDSAVGQNDLPAGALRSAVLDGDARSSALPSTLVSGPAAAQGEPPGDPGCTTA
jgi:hypothetical protein